MASVSICRLNWPSDAQQQNRYTPLAFVGSRRTTG